MEESFWSSDMATVFFGLCHSFIHPPWKDGRPTIPHHSSTFYLDPGLNYRRDIQAVLSLVDLLHYFALIG